MWTATWRTRRHRPASWRRSTIPDRIELELPEGARAVVVSDLHLPVGGHPAVDGGGRRAGRLLGDGRARAPSSSPATASRCWPDHPRSTGSSTPTPSSPRRWPVSRPDRDHVVVLLPGNHDGQLAWDGDSVDILTDRLGVGRSALACDLLSGPTRAVQRVRVVHGNQADPYNTVRGPVVAGGHPLRPSHGPRPPARARVTPDPGVPARRGAVARRRHRRLRRLAPLLPQDRRQAVAGGHPVRRHPAAPAAHLPARGR